MNTGNKRELHMDFIGREQEQRLIKKFFDDDERIAALVYGRRRIGKSELLRQTAGSFEGRFIYYECKQTSEINNVESMAQVLAEEGGMPPFSFSGVEAIFEYLFMSAEKEKTVVVIDEYNYMHDTVKGLDSIFQVLIDKYKGRSRLKLVFCGSMVSTMSNLLEESNPLFGRIDTVIELKPMNYIDSAKFYPGYSPEDKVRIYSVFGGIPYYNRLVDDKKSVRQNIQELISEPGARFENEISMYLRSEINKITNANEVFETMAKGYSRFSDILSQSHVTSSPTLVDVLEKLIKLGLVKKVAPINDERNKKKAGYYIDDNLSLFYYKYIFRYASQRAVMHPDDFFDRYVAKDYEEQHVPKVFEGVCREYLIDRNVKGLLEEPFERIGKYYYDDPKNRTNGEFDVVTEDSRGYIFYEVKFRSHEISSKDIREEIEQVKAAGMNCYKYGFFARCGFGKDVKEDIIRIELKDMFSEKGL